MTIIPVSAFSEPDYGNAGVLFCMVVFEPPHTSFERYVEERLPDVVQTIAGRVIVVIPETAGAIHQGAELRRLFRIKPADVPCMVFAASLRGKDFLICPFAYGTDAEDYVQPAYELLADAADIVDKLDFADETDANIVNERRKQAIDEFKRKRRVAWLSGGLRRFGSTTSMSNAVSALRALAGV